MVKTRVFIPLAIGMVRWWGSTDYFSPISNWFTTLLAFQRKEGAMRGMGVGSWEGFHRTFASTEPSRGSRYARLPRPPHQLSNDITVWQTTQLQSQSNRWRGPLFLPNLYITGNRPESQEGWYKLSRCYQWLNLTERQTVWWQHYCLKQTLGSRCHDVRCSANILFYKVLKTKSFDWF